MEILFLHLSDIHFEKSSDINSLNLTKIVDSMRGNGKFQACVILISGDIAYGGKEEQYKTAWRFMGEIITLIQKKFRINSEVFIVPGNHDVDYSVNPITHQHIQELIKTKAIDAAIPSEIEKQVNYINFAKSNGCFNLQSPIFYRKILEFDTFKFEINLLNSALFSSLDEDKGVHYMPQDVLDSLVAPTEADIALTVMHHSHHWFINSSQAEDALYKKNALIFYGHEHHPNKYDIKAKVDSVKIICGGILCNKGNWNESTFNATYFNTVTYEFRNYEMTWNNNDRIYMPNKTDQCILDKKSCSRIHFQPKKGYLSTFFNDEKNMITKDISDYFVFPLIEEEQLYSRIVAKEISNMPSFLPEIFKKKKIEIIGNENVGKTTLAKQLFKILYNDFVVLFCDMSDIRISTNRRFIKDLFEDIYSEKESDFISYEQMDKTKKILILDNIDSIEKETLHRFRKELEELFEIIICTSKNVIDLNITEKVKRDLDEIEMYQRYKIMQFFNNKREQLVKNLVSIIVKDDVTQQEQFTEILIDALKRQKHLFNLDPNFIVKFTVYYCNNIKEATQNDGSVFSKVFEASLTYAIVPYSKKLKIEKILIILDKIAYYIHVNQAYPIKQEIIEQIVSQYNEDFDSDVNTCDFVGIITNSKIMCCSSRQNQYVFCNRNFLSYFVAREIRRRCQEEQDYTELENVLNFACFGINADILMFITYLTDSLVLLRKIIKTAIEFTKDWPEFNMDEINIQYLMNINPTPFGIEAPKDGDKEKAELLEVEKEKAEKIKDSIKSLNLYGYKEEDIDKTLNQIIRAMSLLNVIARSIPSFEHIMLKEDKELFVDTIYRLPNKIFYKWANKVDEEKMEIMDDLREVFHENQYINKKEELKEESVLMYLQWESISIYLDLLNLSAFDAAKENTDRYLDKYDYCSASSYSFLHLLALSKRDRVDHFIKEADRLDENKTVISQVMIRRVVRNFMIKSPRIQKSQITHLATKYFSSDPTNFFNTDKSSYRAVLIERTRNSRNKM